jgi:hypothetical protein
MQKIALPFVACLLAIAVSGAHAQSLWKWRDASGQLHISDTAPPPGTPAKNIISSPAGVSQAPTSLTTATSSTSSTTTTVATPPAAAGSSAADTELEKRKKAAEKDKADKDKADRAAIAQKNEAIRKDNCTRAQSAAAGLQSGVRIAKIGANGEREFLDDAGRAAELQHAQDVMASNCGPAPAGQ